MISNDNENVNNNQLCQICYYPFQQQKQQQPQNQQRQEQHTSHHQFPSTLSNYLSKYNLSNCNHIYHKNCLYQYLQYKICQSQYSMLIKTKINNKDQTIPNKKQGIKCPDQQCNNILQLNQMHDIILNFSDIIINDNNYNQKLKQQRVSNKCCQNKRLDCNNKKENTNTNMKSNKNTNKLLLQKFYDKLFQNFLCRSNQSIQSQKFHQLVQFQNLQKITINQDQNKKYKQKYYYFYCPTNYCNMVYQYQVKYVEQQLKIENDKGLDQIIKGINKQSQKVEDKLDARKSNNKIHNKQNTNCDFICFSCQQPFCLQCFKPLHVPMNCLQNKINNQYLSQDKRFYEEYLKDKGKKYKKCPKCNFWVQNWRGCITIKCRCGQKFCYKCGKIGCPHGKCLNVPDNSINF